MNKSTPLLIFLCFSLLIGVKVVAQGVAINTTGGTPSTMLHVTNGNTSNNALEILRIDRINTTVTTGGGANLSAALVFYLENSTDNSMTKAGAVEVKYDVATNGSEDGCLLLNIVSGGSYKEGMRVDGTAGYVGINQSNPQARLDVKHGTATSNTVLEVARIERENTTASGAGAAGIGGSMVFVLENSVDGTLTKAGAVTAVFDVATNGSEEGSLLLSYGQNNVVKEGLRVDGTAGFVGVNSSSPSARLTVVEENLVDNTTLEALRIQRINAASSTGGAANIGVSQTFYLESATDLTNVKGASLDVILENATATSEVGTMKFNVAQAGSVSEVMRVDGTAGYVGIGATDPSSKLHVFQNDNNNTVLQLLTLERNKAIGAGAAGLGSQIAFLLEDAGDLEEHADIDARMITAVEGSEDAALEFRVTTDGTNDKLLMGIIGDQGGAVSFFGGVEFPVKSITGATTLTRADYFVKADAAGGAFTVSLPGAGAANLTGHIYIIKRMNAGGNNVTIDPNGAETIDGAATFDLATQYASIMIISDGSNWLIIPK